MKTFKKPNKFYKSYICRRFAMWASGLEMPKHPDDIETFMKESPVGQYTDYLEKHIAHLKEVIEYYTLEENDVR